jgi:PAS domain S-box-containing protein
LDTDIAIDIAVDYRAAFDFAPIGLALSRHRQMVDCNQALCDMFGTSREALVGQSFAVLYPSLAEYERTGARIAPLLGRSGRYADDRLMMRVGDSAGAQQGELFWCHVTGRALSASRVVKADLTAREREVAAYLLEGLTSKQIGKTLAISHRTVEIYRASLMRKYQAHSAADLVHKLMAG